MRSSDTWAKPASRAARATATARPGVCVRSSVASTPGAALCMPSESRVAPARRRARSRGASSVSGFASTVTSAPGTRGMAAIRRASSASERSVGVPPPRNTVLAAGAVPPSTRPASAHSASTASTYPSRATPSPGTYVL